MKKLLLILLCVPLLLSCGEKNEDTGIIPNEGWSQSDISLYVKTCQEGSGDYTQESKDYCECIVIKCMKKWDSLEEMDRDITFEEKEMNEWAESCMLEITQ